MRKLISIGVVLALLVTFMVPAIVAAQDECENPCDYEAPECGPLPPKNTKTLAGAAVWTLLSVQDIMGRAVCATTGQMACNLGGWSDELGVIMVDVSGAVLEGLADLVEKAIIQFLPDYEDLGKAVADLLRGVSDSLGGTTEAA